MKINCPNARKKDDKSMKIKKLSIGILVDNVAGPGGTLGESGFSALAEVTCIDDSKLRILFDTGPSPVALMHNVKNLKVDLTKVDTIVLSHGHWDHVGGLKEAIKMINKRIKLICHPQALQKKILVEKGEEIDIGITEYIDSIEDLKSSVELVTTTDSYHINEVIITTGEIPRINSFEKITGQLRNVSTFKNDMKVKDEIEDDLSLIFKLSSGNVVILTGCCHSGIINTIDHVTKITGHSRITGIIGGLHLIKAPETRIKKTVQSLKKYPIKILVPCHCTGFNGKVSLKEAFPGAFKLATATSTFVFE